MGLRIRSVGEHPVAAESLGVNVYGMKYLGVVMSGALSGLGGAILVIEFAGIYRENQTATRGFIGLAAMIIGNWRPLGTFLAALMFGFFDALQLRSDDSVHAILILVAIALALLAARSAYRQRWTSVLVQLVLAAVFVWWFAITDELPSQILGDLPRYAVLAVMLVAAQRLRMPAADGQPYRKGEET